MKKSPQQNFITRHFNDLKLGKVKFFTASEFAYEIKLAAAIHWYQRGVMSQERAAELAGLNRRDFIHALAREGMDVFILDNASLARELGS